MGYSLLIALVHDRWDGLSAVRIFHLIKGLGRGGAESLLPQSLRAMESRLHPHAYGYLVPRKNALVDELRSAGAERVVCFNADGVLALLGALVKVRREILDWKPDVVHCHLPVSGAIGRLALRGTGIPVVYTEHNLQERYRTATRWVNRLTWGMQSRVVAVSAEVEASVRRSRLVGPPVRVIRNGIPVETFDLTAGIRQHQRSVLGVPEGSFVVGQVAVFRKQKRLDRWIEVASAVHRADPEGRFLLVGDGPLRSEVEARIRSAGLERVTMLPGLKEDVRPYLAAMDLFLVTSDFEGLPLAVLEAMATRLPVVATRAGGIPEVVLPGETGELVDREDLLGLVAAVEDLREKPEVRRRMGEAARDRVEAEFSTRRMVEETFEVYRDVLS